MSQRITKVLGLIALTGLSTFLSGQTMDWKPAGPVYNAGRARNMIVDKNNSQVLYVGSTSSGIFKSTTGGTKWGPINDQATVRNISYMAQSYDGSILVGTGEGFLRPGQKTKAQPGTGLYKLDETASTPTLNLLVSSTVVGNIINRVACNPNNNTHIALATNTGIWVSTNGGTQFNKATLPGSPTGTTVMGQDVKFDSNGILYCSIGVVDGTSTLTPSQIFKSSDASLSGFTLITPVSTVLPDMNYGRIELAVAPSNNNVIYASCSNKYTNPSSATLKGLFVSYDAGATWGLILQGSSQLDPLSNGGTRASGDYAQVILVDPSDPNKIYFGAYSFYYFERTGGSNASPIGNWVAIGQSIFPNNQYYLHENIHDIKLIPGTPNKFYFITDAGVYRSIDLVSLNQTTPPSFQPFYKGLVTGQFNSVSIERYPIGDSTSSTTPGTKVTPYSGFIGGTGGNGLTYFSGRDTLVTTEVSYIGGEVYNSEYSKILPNAAFASTGNGGMYRSTNVKTSLPALVNVNKYINVLSKIAPDPQPFLNNGLTTGTPFKLWENYGNVKPSPDSVIFYNDSVRYAVSMTGVPDAQGVRELTTKKNFVFSTSRPNKFALIDSIVVRTGTVNLPISGTNATLQTPYNPNKDSSTIYVKLPQNYVVTPTITTLSVTPIGLAQGGAVTVTLNATSLEDKFEVKFYTPPFATRTITQYPPNATGTAIVVPDAAVYYRIFATVYYKYKVGDVVSVKDENISTKTTTYTSVLTNSLSWQYGSARSITLAVIPSTVAVTNPTYVLLSSAPLTAAQSSTLSNYVFTTTPYGTATYSIFQAGTYTLTGRPVDYTVGIHPTTYTITGTGAGTSHTLNPGNISQTTNVFTVAPTSATGITYTITSPTTTDTFTFGPTSFSINPNTNAIQSLTSPNIFTVSPTVSTTYTVSQTTGTLTVNTSSTIGTTTYVLVSNVSQTPATVSQTNNPSFTVTLTSPVTYTINGLSSNTLSAPNTTIVYSPVVTTTLVNFGTITLSNNNKPIKIATYMSARLAMVLNNSDNTGSSDAIVVSKNPLALNDPLSLVRVSQSGTYSDNNAGLPTTNSISISGKPTLLEWSKSGTELYFATNTNKLYRVSHITTLQDLSPSSYSGKFYTDIFRYSAPISNATVNPNSPYRTTLIGSFDKPITSISVSGDNKNVAVTFNSTGTGTTSTVMYNTNDARISDETNIAWGGRQGTLPASVTITYCSLMEKDNSNIFFLGTDNGMFYTDNISAASPSWKDVNFNSNSKLPSVQIFDIEQQTMAPWDAYNSGQIYVATNGRGIWTTGRYAIPYVVSVNEYTKPVQGKNVTIWPNPTNGNVNVAFSGLDGETAAIQVMDISGRVLQSEELGKLSSGEVNFTFGTSGLKSGVYIVNITSDSGVKRVTKLIVTK